MAPRRDRRTRLAAQQTFADVIASEDHDENDERNHENDHIDGSIGDNDGGEAPPAEAANLRSMRLRNRAVADREASRLARPDRPQLSRTLGHASKSKSAVMSTPFGQTQSRNNAAQGQVEQEWCGPFSVARQMIAAREDAKRLREEQQAEAENSNKEQHPLDEAMQLVEIEKQRRENPSMNWVSRHRRNVDSTDTSYYAKRRKRFRRQKELMSNGSKSVPSLFQLCVNYLVENFDYVETLGLIDASIRRALCETLVAKGKMNGAAFDVLAEQGVETLELVDCAQVTQDQFCEALRRLLPSGLRAIILSHCGRCFGSKAVEVVSSLKRDEMDLFAISLTGAYLLKDNDMAKFIASTSRTLSSIDLRACPLIGHQFCQAIGEHYSSITEQPSAILLELSLEEVPLSKETLLSLGAASDSLCNLRSLKLKTIEAVDDEVVSILLGSIGSTIEGIDLSNNPQLTDDILSSIRRCNSDSSLRALQLSGLKNLTAIGLEAFFTDIADLPLPPMLRKLDFSHCCYEEINDTVLSLAAKASSFRHSAATEEMSNQRPFHLETGVSNRGGLVHVNVAGSSISDKSMEVLAATCPSSLEELDVSFCANVSDKGLGYLVSKVSSQFSKIHVWGCAQITEEFLDGHDRVEEKGLDIVGVWMKKYGGRSLR